MVLLSVFDVTVEADELEVPELVVTDWLVDEVELADDWGETAVDELTDDELAEDVEELCVDDVDDSCVEELELAEGSSDASSVE